MNDKYTFTSLTRISDLKENSFEVIKTPFDQWATGDYVVSRIRGGIPNILMIELPNGRMVEPMKGDLVVGALGERHATLEATGTWKLNYKNNFMHLLTGAGLMGKMTSRSFLIPPLIQVEYLGHVVRNMKSLNMMDFVKTLSCKKLTTPVILFVGTSMSTGKTTAMRIVTRLLINQGLKVVAAKLTGAGRYKDILTAKDAGADHIYDFVDAGIPSTIYPSDSYVKVLDNLLSMVASTNSDVALIEIGASPLEPYNGEIAISRILEHVRCTILCASDPYAVYGLMHSFSFTPDLVSGPATNTRGGRDLVKELCNVKPLNIVDPTSKNELSRFIMEHLKLSNGILS